jgi:hypothetical protein
VVKSTYFTAHPSPDAASSDGQIHNIAAPDARSAALPEPASSTPASHALIPLARLLGRTAARDMASATSAAGQGPPSRDQSEAAR